jgi:FkbM family methyltransferase
VIYPWTLAGILRHPLSRGRRVAAALGYFGWQLRSRIRRGPFVHEWVGGAKFLVRRGETALTGNVYCGLHDFAEMAFVLHLLRADDLFVDVGANAGAYTLLACAARGAAGVAIEPVPEAFERLRANVALNGVGDRVRLCNCAAGERAGVLPFEAGMGPMSRVALPGERGPAVAEVEVRTLDALLERDAPTMIKIDVEGFETAVLAGARETLSSPSLLALLLETGGAGKRYGYDERALAAELEGRGFAACGYEPFGRTLAPVGVGGVRGGNTLFVRDLDAVRARLTAAPAFTVRGFTV